MPLLYEGIMVIQHTINYCFNKFTCPQAGFEPMTLLPPLFWGGGNVVWVRAHCLSFVTSFWNGTLIFILVTKYLETPSNGELLSFLFLSVVLLSSFISLFNPTLNLGKQLIFPALTSDTEYLQSKTQFVLLQHRDFCLFIC